MRLLTLHGRKSKMAYSKQQRERIKAIIMDGLMGKRQVPGITAYGNPASKVSHETLEQIAELILKRVEDE